MSHDCGSVQDVTSPFHIGPDSGDPPTAPGEWSKALPHVAAPTGTKFVILHFHDVVLPAGNRLEVELGYDVDVFTSADGGQFWTRPVNVAAVGGTTTVPIRYITDGAANGGARVDRYGRGESLPSHGPPHDSITNCDPFLPGAWVEPMFPHPPGTTVPKYDPFWICDKTMAPAWQNVRCAPAGDLRRTIAQSVGMIVTVHAPSADHPEESVSTCSVTLIDADLVLLAGHCLPDHGFEVPTSSVTFDFEVACDGTVLPAYNAVFFKVIKLVKFRWEGSGNRDYAIVQVRGAPSVPPVPVRATAPAVGEAVFGLHHPNGAVKKVSPSATGTTPVASTGSKVEVNLDVAGGSSGSGLFDLSGRVVGVLSTGGPCDLFYWSTASMLADPTTIPTPPTSRSVMVVLDRSGSMSETAGDGNVKIDEAREAAELFISLLRSSSGNEAGLVSFASSATSPVEGALAAVTNGHKGNLVGELPGISPSGSTSIGDGLEAARDELAGGPPPRTVLLLTDGMENAAPFIDQVAGLADIDITAIGFGTESNLDGPKLTDLAQTHDGFYKRAGTGLELRKFFALAFGDIFEAGALLDPELRLPAGRREGTPVPFDVCGEEAVTVVTGWDVPTNRLGVVLRTPSGQVVNLGASGIELQRGSTWAFARVPLPAEGEHDGTWTANVVRERHGGTEFQSPAQDLTYFVNVIARGGPHLRPLDMARRLYTGDRLNPRVILQYDDQSVPRAGSAEITLLRPAVSVGTTLSQHGLGPPTAVQGDAIPARQATLRAIEAASGQPFTSYVTESHTLSTDSATTGTFMPAGVFGALLDDALVVDGTYTFHARARFGQDCTSTREVQWSHHVHVGIDPGATTVTAEPAGTSPGGGERIRLTITPRDRYGNHLGPGEGGDFDVDPLPGCVLGGDVVDLGDGRYRVELECDPDREEPTGVTVTQPERDPVDLVPERTGPPRVTYRYSVTMACGRQPGSCCTCPPLSPGRYATAITMLNPTEREAHVRATVVPTVLAGAAAGRWPASAAERAKEELLLPSLAATTLDCCSLSALLLGATPDEPALTLAVVVIESRARLEVSAMFTAAAKDGEVSSIDVVTIEPVEMRPAPATLAPVQRRPKSKRG